MPTSPPQTCRSLPVGKPLEDWDPEVHPTNIIEKIFASLMLMIETCSQEVEHWFTRLPRVENYRELLLPEDGSVVATIWDKQVSTSDSGHQDCDANTATPAGLRA